MLTVGHVCNDTHIPFRDITIESLSLIKHFTCCSMVEMKSGQTTLKIKKIKMCQTSLVQKYKKVVIPIRNIVNL